MKILWIINIVLPEALKLLNKFNDLKSTGGWLLGAANVLGDQPEVKLIIACPSSQVNELRFLQGEKIGYYVFPKGKGNMRENPEYRKYWRRITEDIKPDIVHIHGSEYSHGLEYVKECGPKNVVVSIQGLTSVYYKYYYAGLSIHNILRNLTLRDIIRGTIIREKKDFKKRSNYEIQLLQSVNHVIGRTSWDKAHVWAINPHIQYHFCNETLRHCFYEGEKWKYNNCTPHSIFLSQATYPIKGLHIVLQAMPLILRHYPDAQIHVAGRDITLSTEGIKGRLRLSGYGKILKSLLNKYQLNDKILFLGNLNAEDMKTEYLRANVFVCPSSIENSPNSIGEAQILGTPVVASYVGGVSDMMKDNEDNLYRFNEVEMLAKKICEVFEKKDKQIDMTDIANKRHDRYHNLETTIEIYNEILKTGE